MYVIETAYNDDGDEDDDDDGVNYDYVKFGFFLMLKSQ